MSVLSGACAPSGYHMTQPLTLGNQGSSSNTPSRLVPSLSLHSIILHCFFVDSSKHPL